MSKFLFIVQGEGRGHLTQALSLQQILTDAGHTVVAAAVGTKQGRVLPAFFIDKITCPIHTFRSPHLIYSPRTHALDVWQTILTQVPLAYRYLQSAHQIQSLVHHYQPDVVINFYDVVGGLWRQFFEQSIPMVCVGHQYLFLHQAFTFPPHSRLNRWLVNLNTRLTALRATKLLALSFEQLAQDERIITVPPLLRQEVTDSVSRDVVQGQQPFLLAYLTLPDLADELIRWHQLHPNVMIHCFWNHPDHPSVWHLHGGQLVFHPIDGEQFLSYMRQCNGLITTAGFESVCEAMYLGKPVMMIPVPKHFEQGCNAYDATKAGAGMRATSFSELEEFLHYLPFHHSIQADFQAWQRQSSCFFLRELETLSPAQSYRERVYRMIPKRQRILRPTG